MDPRHRDRVRVSQKNWFFLVDADDVRRLGVEALLDALRHDQAVPQNTSPDGYIMFKSPDFPTTARWTSFGAPVIATSRDSEEVVRQLRILEAESARP
jgi:hypothetical protein